ncbi:conserved unknown protein [Ectocarpus siliculosus]|uniref:Formamidopyrimidine-DNA glycosylase catalytic domain-containing protein n=1 Tax=Ectocarpus siliculosus TaxID=2880 RepID=D7FQF2_ECTSI|nr:conserved unknown protein [Ectocarpus siliculosus]|eukprot:CBJ48484.1 conserved unknown protein [Ectocarpus siliculosus]
MPELPEVETSRLYVEEFCLGSTITNVHATEQGGGPRDGQFDDIVIGEDMTAKSLKDTLEGRKIVELRRRGKQMWFVLDKPPHPLFHFGMTGAFTVKGEKRHKFVKFKVSEEWPPRFAKLEIQMSNGACLALTDPRRLSRVKLRAEPEASPPISLLGPDPLTHPLSLETFAAALAKPTAPIKAVLLAQDRVVSGVGNWVADEVCFQACVHPGAACNTLDPEQIAALHSRLLSVCREACEARADYTSFPKEWLFHHRWGKGKNSEGAPRVSSGHPIVFDVVGGRTTAIVPAVQKKGLLRSPTAASGGVDGRRSGSASGKKPKPPAAMAKPKTKARGDGVGEGNAKAVRQTGGRDVTPKKEDQEGQDKSSVENKKSVKARTAAKKTGRVSTKAKDVAPVAKKGGGPKKKSAAGPAATAPGSSARGGGRKKATPTMRAAASKLKTDPSAQVPTPAARGKQATAVASKVAVAPKRGRAGGDDGGVGKAVGAASAKRAKTTKVAVKPERIPATAVASQSCRTTTAKRAPSRRSPRLSV